MVALIASLVAAVVIGAGAREVKHRSAIAWGLAAFICCLVPALMVGASADLVRGLAPEFLVNVSATILQGVIAFMITGVLALVVLAVPSLGTRCPACAERVLRAALKCRFCGTDLRLAGHASNALKRPVEPT